MFAGEEALKDAQHTAQNPEASGYPPAADQSFVPDPSKTGEECASLCSSVICLVSLRVFACSERADLGPYAKPKDSEIVRFGLPACMYAFLHV